ncbi:ArsC family reductase [Rivibacter subsaxonicus]|uniref:Spx/MgsR family transcriptional regulator n=1 Tax=Rivibacter subsaxonicus TaxID=457575 RepID=A0A4Q7VNX6_9BURK|nr:ArsC family reductase [Rivibacter subsaxonicus]RZT98091.1 Spx/MgsR family transcriptional regulator [Rivibacter subsaxonicus]
MSEITLYGISNCDTVKRARAWLATNSVPYRFHDFKKAGLDAERLAHWVAAVGWEPLLNRRGTTWRQLPAERQAAALDGAGAQALMLDQLSVIKRPVVEWSDGNVTVGFAEAVFEAQRG